MAIVWALVEKGSRKILIEGKDKNSVVNRAQSIINRNPRKRYRYVRINVDPKMPWFKKGE